MLIVDAAVYMNSLWFQNTKFYNSWISYNVCQLVQELFQSCSNTVYQAGSYTQTFLPFYLFLFCFLKNISDKQVGLILLHVFK